MSFNEQKLASKLNSLDETQPAIVSVSEWILFYRENSKQSIKVWADHLMRCQASQKLPCFYVANEILQKSRATKKTEFIDGYAEVLPDVLNKVYRQLDPPVQMKYKRVLDIWKDRNIFDNTTLKKLYAAISGKNEDAFARSSVSTQRPTAEMAPELIPLSSAYNRLSHSSSLFSSNHLKFESIYRELFANEYNLPAPDIFISKLDQLKKLNDHSVNSLNDIISIRESLIRDLTRVITTQQALIETDRSKITGLKEKGVKVDDKRKELEEYIQEGNENDDDYDVDGGDDMVPAYANSDSENENSNQSLKRQKTEAVVQDNPTGDIEEEEDESPAYEANSDSDSDSRDYNPAFNGPQTINPNLASLLSKLSE